jgi:integrase
VSHSRRRIPKHCPHKASNRGVVRLNGQDHYTGPWNTADADSAYERLIGEWLANGRALPAEPVADRTSTGTAGTGPTIAELILAFWRHAEIHYRHADGTPTSELANYRQSLRLLRAMYEDEPAAAFSPSKLKAIRARWVANGICRHQVNLRVGRVKRVFKWAVSEELVPVTVFQALCTVQGLQANRTEAVESKAVEVVSDMHVAAAVAHLRPQVRDMVEVQRLTGMRPGEVCQMHWRDIDTSSDVWVFHPVQHKTAWRGKERVVFIGPKARAILTGYANNNPDAYLFSPREAVEQLHRERAEKRTTKYYASRQGGQQRKADPKRKPKDKYTVTAYGQAVRRACRKAGIPIWKPNQLRHTTGTEVRKVYGVEAAQVILGHSKADVTQVYAERDQELARRVAGEIG